MVSGQGRLAGEYMTPPQTTGSVASRPTLGASDVLAAAVDITRQEGMAALTVRRLCQQLDVTPPTIYWHVKSMSALVDMVVDEVVGRFAKPGPQQGDWVERMRVIQISVYETVVQVPGLAAVLARSLPTDAGLDNAAFALSALQSHGFSDTECMSIFNTLSSYTMGYLLYVDAFLAPAPNSTSSGKPRRNLAMTMTERREALADRPELRPFVATFARFNHRRAREQFMFGLDILLEGLAREMAPVADS
jgi:AcrR family transcriptional regulator